MQRCPHCGQLSISVFSPLAPPYDGRVRCARCSAVVKVKKRLLNFLLPIYFLLRGFVGLVFGVHLDLSFSAEMSLVVAVFLLQLKLLTYEDTNTGRPPGMNQPQK